MSLELRGVDRWIEREEGDGEPARSVSARWVECTRCRRQDEACNQRRCRHCGSTAITQHGGQPHRRRRYDE